MYLSLFIFYEGVRCSILYLWKAKQFTNVFITKYTSKSSVNSNNLSRVSNWEAIKEFVRPLHKDSWRLETLLFWAHNGDKEAKLKKKTNEFS